MHKLHRNLDATFQGCRNRTSHIISIDMKLVSLNVCVVNNMVHSSGYIIMQAICHKIPFKVNQARTPSCETVASFLSSNQGRLQGFKTNKKTTLLPSTLFFKTNMLACQHTKILVYQLEKKKKKKNDQALLIISYKLMHSFFSFKQCLVLL